MTLAKSRLRHLERTAVLTSQASSGVSVFFPHELAPCKEHQDCSLELASGEHHRGVIRLTFDADQLKTGGTA
jgi:hypothetical protein